MRLVAVSAHYPPNFVSGGTLAPQRLAHALRARGHDVSVYAGFLDASRPPLQTWTEQDQTGMPVRWVVTTPWIGWSDRRNFDNPDVAADFAAHVADQRPDVVHLHSLQSLGAGLIPAARAAGASVVLTMHDFWWLCARQFLVDRDYRPCCLVVDAGSCQCEVDRAWLADRAAFLRDRLTEVDRILVPSALAGEVLLANGVDPDRLAVDENGMVEGEGRFVRVPAPPRLAGDGGLRLVYAGGDNLMKGVAVLFDAAGQLAVRDGWQLKAYGAAPYVAKAGIDVGDLPIEVLAPFPPDQLDPVLAETDVLVVPSIMRESHSLITREALARGVPVVCTDTLGPEQVVVDGVNGLVVAAGDAGSLAAALRRLLDSPELVTAMKGATPPALRTVANQVDGLEELYAHLREARAGVGRMTVAASAPRSVKRVVFVCGIEGAPLRYRARLPAEGLALLGIDSDVLHYRDPELDRLAADAEAVVLYRVPATHQILAFVNDVRQRGTPVLFDVDDLIFDPEIAEHIPALRLLPADEAELWMEGVRRYRTTLEACDAYIGSTEALCRHAAAVTGLPTEQFDNGVGLLLSQSSDVQHGRPRSPGPLRIGYLSGTITHDHDWLVVEPAVIDVLRGRPDVELWLAGLVTPSPALASVESQVRRLPLVPWLELPAVLRDLDVNLAPLELGGVFNEAKSAIKWVEAALTGTPTIASPTQPFREVIEDGVNGFLAADHADWVGALDRLLGDGEHRRAVGGRARRDALLRLSPHRQGRRYRAILERAVERGVNGAARPSTWSPVVHDEPPMPVELEPYAGALPTPLPSPSPPEPVTAPSPRPLTARIVRVVRRAAVMSRDEGFKVTARRAVAAVRRRVTRS